MTDSFPKGKCRQAERKRGTHAAERDRDTRSRKVRKGFEALIEMKCELEWWRIEGKTTNCWGNLEINY